jgi:hypothetical protein
LTILPTRERDKIPKEKENSSTRKIRILLFRLRRSPWNAKGKRVLFIHISPEN